MPIPSQTESTVTWRDQITEEEIVALAESKIDLETFYVFDEFYNDINNDLIGRGGDSAIYITSSDLIPILIPVWESHLPQQDLPANEI